MVRAGDQLRAQRTARLGQQQVRAVLTGIVKGPDRPVAAAQHQHRLVDDKIGEVIAAPGDIGHMADTAPAAAKDLPLFQLEPAGIEIRGRRQRRGRLRVLVEVE